MPVYTYNCSQCNEFFEIRHGMTEKAEECKLCKSDKIKKVPSMPLLLKKDVPKDDGKVGDVTKEFIENSREELKKEKKILKEKTYEDE